MLGKSSYVVYSLWGPQTQLAGHGIRLRKTIMHATIPQITRAVPTQANCLTEIAHAAKRHWGYPEHWIRSWQAALTVTPDQVAQQLTFVATLHHRPVGFYALSSSEKHVSLEHLWVHPTAMGQGIGRHMFQHAAQQVTRSGAHVLFIESDPHAEGFYRRMGARRVGQTVSHLEGQARRLPLLIYDHEPIIPPPSGRHRPGRCHV